MNMSIYLDSNSLSSESSNEIVVGYDIIPKLSNKEEWFFKSLNYSSILKSEAELKNRKIFDKIKVVSRDLAKDDIIFPTSKLSRYTLYSEVDKYEFPNRLIHSFKLANTFKWICDSVTFDMISSTNFFTYNITENDAPFRLDSHRYNFARLLMNLNISSLEINITENLI